MFLAGPGFNAGRYGLACGAITAAIRSKLGIPAVTGLFRENPGAELYSGLCYIIGTDNNARRMASDMENMVSFGIKLLSGESPGAPEDDGYLGTGPIRELSREVSGPARAVDMALDKYYGRKFVTEVPIPQKEVVPPASLGKPLSSARVVLVTDGGLVPKGNPDRMVPVNSVKFACYSFEGRGKLDPNDYEVKHQGYNNAYVLDDPNRLVPVDAMRFFESEGAVGKLEERFFTTAGVMTTLENSKKFGQGIAGMLKNDGVDAAILTST
jgi:glycine reductase